MYLAINPFSSLISFSPSSSVIETLPTRIREDYFVVVGSSLSLVTSSEIGTFIAFPLPFTVGFRRIALSVDVGFSATSLGPTVLSYSSLGPVRRFFVY